MDEESFLKLDKRKARRSFSRAAPDYDDAAVLQHEIGRRMLERLDYVRLEPRVILDIGCGTGLTTEGLMKRYPAAQVLALDFALPMLERTRRRGRLLRRPRCLCGDLDFLPLADQSVDLVFSNASLQWSTRPAQAFADIARVLRPGGLVMFSSFGPDTLQELRAAWAAVDGTEHVHGFIDMHDYGDMLMAAGLADPVMDAERMTLTYAGCNGVDARDQGDRGRKREYATQSRPGGAEANRCGLRSLRTVSFSGRAPAGELRGGSRSRLGRHAASGGW